MFIPVFAFIQDGDGVKTLRLGDGSNPVLFLLHGHHGLH
jgi:hypothetical protein